MIKPVRKAGQWLVLATVAMISAGCAQTSGTYVEGDATLLQRTDSWPTPKVANAPAPQPPEPTLLPQAAMPVDSSSEAAAPQVAPQAPRRTAPRRAATTAPTAATPTTVASTAALSTAAAAPADVWQRVRSGLTMPPLDSSLVSDWENYYSSRPDYFGQMIQNSSRFLYHITNEVEKRGMPLEIALLPMIESAYNPVAYSSAHASGIWQFIPSTGKNYGLKQNWWYDGRRDVIAATGAALDYLQTLYGMFNDWQLALAAYNWGEGAVQRAVDRNVAKGLAANYSSLENMPAETRNYLPKLMAVKNLIANPGRYGLTLAHVPNEPYFELVTVTRHIDVARAAQFADMTLDEFKFLNPAHNKRVINSNSAETIVLPKHKVQAFMTSMSQSEDKPLVSMKTHHVRAGERPETIAAEYGISVAELNNLNGIGGRRRIATGQTLLVPNLTDLQPKLDDIPVAVSQFDAANRTIVHTRMQRMVITRGGVRRTVMVAVPVRPAATLARAPLHKAVAAAKRHAGGNSAAPTRAAKSGKAGLQKVVYTNAPAAPAASTKAKRR